MTVLVGRYRLVERLRETAAAIMWRAYDQRLDRYVTVKTLADGCVADATSRQQLRAEARAAAAVTHPTVVDVYDYGEGGSEPDDCQPFIVFEHLEGSALAARLRSGPLPMQVALDVCADVAAALAAAHARGVVHGGVRPNTIMLTPVGSKLIDFGVPPPALSQYLAPEQTAGDQALPASDVYALGLLLWSTLAGKLPWSVDDSGQQTGHRHLGRPRLPAIPGLPAAVATLCRRCLADDPLARPTAEEAAEILAEASGRRSTVHIEIPPHRPHQNDHDFPTQPLTAKPT